MVSLRFVESDDWTNDVMALYTHSLPLNIPSICSMKASAIEADRARNS